MPFVLGSFLTFHGRACEVLIKSGGVQRKGNMAVLPPHRHQGGNDQQAVRQTENRCAKYAMTLSFPFADFYLNNVSLDAFHFRSFFLTLSLFLCLLGRDLSLAQMHKA